MTTSLSIEIPPPDEESGHSDQVMTQQQQQQQIETNDEITNRGHTILSLQEHDNDSEHDEGDTSSISSIKQDLVVPSPTINHTSSPNVEGEQNDDKVENNSFNNNNDINHPQDIVTQDGSASVSSFFDRVKAILSPATTFVSSSASTEDNQSKKQSDIGSMCGDPNNVDNNNDDDNFIDESNYNDDTQERPGVDEVTFYVSEPPTPIMANKGKNKPTSFSEDSALSDLLEKEKKLLQQKEAKSKAEEVNENYDMFEDESLLTEPTLPSSTGSPSFNSSSDNSISQEDNACATAIVYPPKSPPKSPMRKTPSPKKKRKTLDKPFAFGEMSNSALGGQLKKHVSGFPYGRRWTLITVAFALNSLVFSFLCKHSTSFVTLEKPMLLSATFEPITEVGLFYLKLCLAKTIVNKDHQLGVETIVQNSWIIPGGSETFNLGDFSREYTIYSGNTSSSSSSSLDQKMMFYDDPICTTASMNSEMVDDLMWKLARTFVGWTTVYGIFMTAVVFCIAFWSSVSLNNISVCLLMLYFFQCLVFFFFDCKLCQKHICALSSGAIHALVATLSWFVSGMSCIRLLFLERERIRADRRKRRREMRRQQRASSHLSLSPTKSVRSTYSELRSVPSPIKLSTTSENGQSMNLISPSKSITSSLHNII